MGWFHQWFGTRYYKLLYQHRDDSEAQFFLDRLMHYLALPQGSRILDVGCGKGRHSIYLSQKGFDVTGLDVVPENIEEASRSANEHLHFLVHDMREPFPVQDIDLVVNVFTSFGYFESDEEDLRTLQNIYNCLKPGGIFVQDFFNTGCVIDKLVSSQTIERENVVFNIHKKVENRQVIKDIEVVDGQKHCHYREQVKLLRLPDFENYYRKVGFTMREVFGNYRLEPYQAGVSDRLIMISEKR